MKDLHRIDLKKATVNTQQGTADFSMEHCHNDNCYHGRFNEFGRYSIDEMKRVSLASNIQYGWKNLARCSVGRILVAPTST